MAGGARAALGQAARPAFELLTGLSPSIGVAQRGAIAPSARATVGTVTELHDLLRVLFGRTGVQHCPGCGRVVAPVTADAIVDELVALPEGSALSLLAPVARRRVGGVRALVEELGRQGFSRVRLDGEVHRIEEVPAVDARCPHDLDVVVDRLRAGPDRRERLQDSLATVLKLGRGAALAEVGGTLRAWATRPYCGVCDRELPPLGPRLFSFNSPAGACPACQGLGVVRRIDAERLVDPKKTLAEGAVEGWRAAKGLLEEAARRRGIPLDRPWASLSWEHRDLLLHGDGEMEGAVKAAARRANAPWIESDCGECGGSRLAEAARHVRVEGRSLPELLALPLGELRASLASFSRGPLSGPVLDELDRRVAFLVRTGLHYVRADRAADSLSGGELQRLRLGAQAGNQLQGVLYVLDEPTAGLHPEDTAALLEVLLELRDLGNTVLVVDHDPAVIARADHVVEFGPGAGVDGGAVVYEGPPAGLRAAPTLTGRWLRGDAGVPAPHPTRPRHWLELRGLRGHNLQGDARFPLGMLVGVGGRSGAGKSSLVEDSLGRALARRLHPGGPEPLPFAELHGAELVRRLVRVDQAPLGRSARSNVATATKLWDAVRQLYAKTPEARARGFGPEHFSTNQAGGRCTACEGEGRRHVEMLLLPDVVVQCEQCEGRRFDEATLSVSWKGHNVADLLEMRVREARKLFSAFPAIAGPLEVLDALGLGYLPLGQPGDSWSGGEAQRVKLAQQLGKPGEVEGALYLLDEPTIGLHPADVAALVEALRRLVTLGGSVIVVEHDEALLGACDWRVELGPGAGPAGGRVIREGPAWTS